MANLSSKMYNGLLPISAGGTGATTANGALTNLSAQPTLISGTTIKTINGTSVLGSTNISIIYELVPTAVQTNTYNAAACELVKCNSTANTFTVNLPLSPVDGDIIGFIDIVGKFGTNPVTISGNGKTIESDTSLILNITGISIVVMYNSINNNWAVLHDRSTSFGLIPNAPIIGTATVNQLTVTIPFTSPTFNGNSTIIKYTATSSPGGLTGTITQAGSGSVTVTGLSYSTSYTFTVVATNEFGDSIPSSASNSITVLPPPSSVGYLIVAGGGAGGGAYATSGGGGGGGFLLNTTAVSADTIYTVTVGAGGITTYYNGVNSSFGITGSIITATGGGYGGQNTNPGGNGGSGGGGSGTSGGTAGGTGTSGQGFAGGVGQASGGGGGGGGAGGSAANVNFGSYAGSAGGPGLTGFGIDCSGGGGGGTAHSASTPGSSSYGGGAGGKPGVNQGYGISGTVNTGGGGGGGGFSGGGGAGGSGIVIVRYANTFRTATTTGSPTFTDDGTYKIYKFTGSGTISF